MATNANLKNAVPGGNMTLWLTLLGSPFAWLCQLQLSYMLVPWSCARGHVWVLRLSWLPFLAATVLLGAIAARAWMRLGMENSEAAGVARSRFMAVLGFLIGALSAFLILAQGIATFIFDPCLR